MVLDAQVKFHICQSPRVVLTSSKSLTSPQYEGQTVKAVSQVDAGKVTLTQPLHCFQSEGELFCIRSPNMFLCPEVFLWRTSNWSQYYPGILTHFWFPAPLSSSWYLVQHHMSCDNSAKLLSNSRCRDDPGHRKVQNGSCRRFRALTWREGKAKCVYSWNLLLDFTDH